MHGLPLESFNFTAPFLVFCGLKVKRENADNAWTDPVEGNVGAIQALPAQVSCDLHGAATPTRMRRLRQPKTAQPGEVIQSVKGACEVLFMGTSSQLDHRNKQQCNRLCKDADKAGTVLPALLF